MTYEDREKYFDLMTEVAPADYSAYKGGTNEADTELAEAAGWIAAELRTRRPAGIDAMEAIDLAIEFVTVGAWVETDSNR